MSEINEYDDRVARRMIGYFIDKDVKDIIQIEYRYSRNKRGSQYDFYTRIKEREFRITNNKYFGGIADLLDQLPKTSAIIIPHQVLLTRDKSSEIVIIEEWLYPYERPGADTVIYQLKLIYKDEFIETPRITNEGYPVVDFGSAVEYLRRQLNKNTHLKICYFCKYLIEFNDFGGTDYRHDQLYCFRDDQKTLDIIMKTYPILRDHEALLSKATPDIDALHSCDAFVYRKDPRP